MMSATWYSRLVALTFATFGTTLGLEVDESSFKLRVATIPVHQLIRILADHSTRKSARTTLETKDGERA
jgi:hypothetical protein